MTEFAPLKVGHFHCEYVGPTNMGHRWKVINSTTNSHHHTYGTRQEVEKMCSTSMEAWSRKLKVQGMVGSAWRLKPAYQKKTDGKETKKDDAEA